MQKGQIASNVLIGLAVSLLSFIGGGTFMTKGNSEIRSDVSVLKTENVGIKEDVSEIKVDIKEIRLILFDLAVKEGIRKEQKTATTSVYMSNVNPVDTN